MDTTDLVVEILSEALGGVPVSTDVPSNRPLQMVTVDLVGDQSTEYLLQPTYALTCWGRTDREAKSIALGAVDALWAAADTHPYLSACSLQSLSRDEWVANGQGRYLAMVELTVNTY